MKCELTGLSAISKCVEKGIEVSLISPGRQQLSKGRSNAVASNCYIRLHYDFTIRNIPGKLLNR